MIIASSMPGIHLIAFSQFRVRLKTERSVMSLSVDADGAADTGPRTLAPRVE